MLDVVVLIEGTGNGAIADFESRALTIVRAHGGEVLSAFKPAPAPGEPAVSDEIHVLRFPSKEALAAYRSDPALAALATLRAKVR